MLEWEICTYPGGGTEIADLAFSSPVSAVGVQPVPSTMITHAAMTPVRQSARCCWPQPLLPTYRLLSLLDILPRPGIMQALTVAIAVSLGASAAAASLASSPQTSPTQIHNRLPGLADYKDHLECFYFLAHLVLVRDTNCRQQGNT